MPRGNGRSRFSTSSWIVFLCAIFYDTAYSIHLNVLFSKIFCLHAYLPFTNSLHVCWRSWLSTTSYINVSFDYLPLLLFLFLSSIHKILYGGPLSALLRFSYLWFILCMLNTPGLLSLFCVAKIGAIDFFLSLAFFYVPLNEFIYLMPYAICIKYF